MSHKITICIEIDGNKIELDLQDAKKLKEVLDEVLGAKEYVPYYPAVPYNANPWPELVRPIWYQKKWIPNTGDCITFTGSTTENQIKLSDNANTGWMEL